MSSCVPVHEDDFIFYIIRPSASDQAHVTRSEGCFYFFSLVLFCWINQKFHIYKILKGRKTCWLIWKLLLHFVSITLSPSCALHHICWTMETIFHFPWNIWSQLNCPVSQLLVAGPFIQFYSSETHFLKDLFSSDINQIWGGGTSSQFDNGK